MHARTTGWAMLVGLPQEAHDLAAVAHVAPLRTRVLFLHLFDGFRTSHEIDPWPCSPTRTRASSRTTTFVAFPEPGVTPDAPECCGGSAQNPDVFQGAEASNPSTRRSPTRSRPPYGIALAERTGRRSITGWSSHGAADAERVVVASGLGGVDRLETAEALNASATGGRPRVRLYAPSPTEALLAALPPTTGDRGAGPGPRSPGRWRRAAHLDVVTARAEDRQRAELPQAAPPRPSWAAGTARLQRAADPPT